MQHKLSIVILLALFSLMSACQKQFITSTLPASTTAHKGLLSRIQQGTDRNLNNDTINMLLYDSRNRLITIIDSVYQDTLTGYYNEAGLLETVREISPYGNDHCTYTYNSDSQLTVTDETISGVHQQYLYEYTENVLSKATYFSNAGAGSLVLSRYCYYTVTDGNISEVSEYTANGNVLKSLK